MEITKGVTNWSLDQETHRTTLETLPCTMKNEILESQGYLLILDLRIHWEISRRMKYFKYFGPHRILSAWENTVNFNVLWGKKCPQK